MRLQMQMRLQKYKSLIFRCINCNTCKYGYTGSPELGYPVNCPAGRKFGWLSYFGSGRMAILKGLLSGELNLSPDLSQIFYRCNICGNCEIQCENEIPIIDIFEEFRADLVEAGYGPMAEHKPLIDSLRSYDNPWFGPRALRDRWARGLGIKDASKHKVDILYFVGCTASYDPNLNRIAQATVKIMKAAGLDFGILGRSEKCCGSTALRIGQRDLGERLAKQTLEALNRSGASRVVTACAGCLRTISRDFPKLGELRFEAIHVSQLIQELISEGKLDLINPINAKITYHDPCHLGRHLKIFDPPRQVIKSLPGVEFVEMKRIKQDSWCCGAGGGVRTAFTDWALETSKIRVQEAEETGADYLVSTCPFCYQNLSLGISELKSRIQMMDLMELVARALPGS